MQFVDLKTQYNRVKNEINVGIQKVLDHGKYILGPEVQECEKALAKFTGAKHCLLVASGTDALLIAMMALGIKAGDEIITTPFSFFATVETLLLLGAKPVFVDIDSKTYNLDVNQIESAITPKTKLILPVSLYGQCPDFDAINAIAKKHNLPVLEDSAQSMGATYKGKHSCNLSTVAATSFFPSKPLGCYGDGGACFTNDDNLFRLMFEIRDHGQDRRYHHTHLGVNGRLDSIQATILLAKLAIFPEEIIARQKIAARYTKLLSPHLITPYVEPHNTSVYAQYTIQVENRDAVQKKLQEFGIPTAVHYPEPMYKQPVISSEYKNLHLPNVERIASKVLSLPLHPYISEAQQDLLVEKLLQN